MDENWTLPGAIYDWLLKFKPSVGRLKDQGNVSGLIDALNDPERRNDAEAALVEMGESAIGPLMQSMSKSLKRGDTNRAFTCCPVLAKIGKPAIRPLVQHMATTEYDSVRFIFWKFFRASAGEVDIEPLLEALKDEDWRMRKGAAEALRELKDVQAVEPLIQALKDEVSHVRWAAASALGNTKDRRAVRPLIQAFDVEDDEYARYRVALALGGFRGGESDERVLNPLVRALKDGRGGAKRDAAIALECAGDCEAAIGALVEALSDKQIKASARITLEKIGEPALQALELAMRQARGKLDKAREIDVERVKAFLHEAEHVVGTVQKRRG